MEEYKSLLQISLEVAETKENFEKFKCHQNIKKERHFPTFSFKSKEIIPSNIAEEIEIHWRDNERKRRDICRRQLLEDAKIRKLEKKIRKASRRKAQKVKIMKNEDFVSDGNVSDLSAYDASFQDSKKVMNGPLDDNQQKTNPKNEQKIERDIFTFNQCQRKNVTLEREWQLPVASQEQSNMQNEPLKLTESHPLKSLTMASLPVNGKRNFGNCKLLLKKYSLFIDKSNITKSCKTLWPINDKSKNNSNSVASTTDKVLKDSESQQVSDTKICLYYPNKCVPYMDNLIYLKDKSEIQKHFLHLLPFENLQPRWLSQYISVNLSSEFFSPTEKVKLRDPVFSHAIMYFSPRDNQNNTDDAWSLPKALIDLPGEVLTLDDGHCFVQCKLESKYELHPNKKDEHNNMCDTSTHRCNTDDCHCLQPYHQVLMLDKDVESPCRATLAQSEVIVATDCSAKSIHVSEILQNSDLFSSCSEDPDIGVLDKDIDTSSLCNGTSNINCDFEASLFEKNENFNNSLDHGLVLEHWDDDESGLKCNSETQLVKFSFPSTTLTKEFCTKTSTEKGIETKFEHKQTFIEVAVNEKQVNPHKVVNNMTGVKDENIVQTKVIVPDSTNEKLMSVWDLIEPSVPQNNNLEKAISKVHQNASPFEIKGQQKDTDGISELIKGALASSRNAMMKKPDLNSSYSCHIKEIRDNFKIDDKKLDHLLLSHNSQSVAEVVNDNSCKDQQLGDMRFDILFHDKCQTVLNKKFQEPHNVSRGAGIKVCKNYNVPCSHEIDIIHPPLIVSPHKKLICPPPGLIWPTKEFPASQQHLINSLATEVQSPKRSLYTNTAHGQIISTSDLSVDSNKIATSPNLNLKLHTKQHQLIQFYLMLSDLQNKIKMLASTAKVFGTVNVPLAGASNIFDNLLEDIGTLNSEKELSFEQIESIIYKLVFKTAQNQSREQEITFSNLNTQNICAQNSQNAFPAKQFEITKTQHKELRVLDQKGFLKRSPVLHSAEIKACLSKKQKTIHSDKENPSFEPSGDKCLSNEQLNKILKKLPPAPDEEENRIVGIDTGHQALETLAVEAGNDHIAVRSTTELASSYGKLVNKLSYLRLNKTFHCEDSSSKNLQSSRVEKELNKLLCKPTPKFPQTGQELNFDVSHQTSSRNPQDSTTTKKPNLPYAYARAVFSDLKKTESSHFNFRLPPPSQRPVLSVTKRMPKTPNSLKEC